MFHLKRFWKLTTEGLSLNLPRVDLALHLVQYVSFKVKSRVCKIITHIMLFSNIAEINNAAFG